MSLAISMNLSASGKSHEPIKMVNNSVLLFYKYISIIGKDLKNQSHIVIPEGIYHQLVLRRGYLMHHLRVLTLALSFAYTFIILFIFQFVSLTYLVIVSLII